MPTLLRQITRIDTAANWTSTNPTLEPGVQGVEEDTGKFKVCGTPTAWNSLAYASVTTPIAQSDVSGLVTDLGNKTSHPQTMSRVSLGI